MQAAEPVRHDADRGARARSEPGRRKHKASAEKAAEPKTAPPDPPSRPAAPRPQRVGRTPIADEFETDVAPADKPRRDETPIAEEFEQ
jgi:hypothetical protein